MKQQNSKNILRYLFFFHMSFSIVLVYLSLKTNLGFAFLNMKTDGECLT